MNRCLLSRMQQPLVDESADLNRSAGEEQLDEPPVGRRGEEGARVRTGSEAWNSPGLPPCAQMAAAREGRRGGDEVKGDGGRGPRRARGSSSQI